MSLCLCACVKTYKQTSYVLQHVWVVHSVGSVLPLAHEVYARLLLLQREVHVVPRNASKYRFTLNFIRSNFSHESDFLWGKWRLIQQQRYSTCFLRRCSVSVGLWWTWRSREFPELLWVGVGMPCQRSGRRARWMICCCPLSCPAFFFSGWQKDYRRWCLSGWQVQKYSHRSLKEKSKVKLGCVLLLSRVNLLHGSHRERTQRRWACLQSFCQSWWLQTELQKAENLQCCQDSSEYIQSLLVKQIYQAETNSIPFQPSQSKFVFISYWNKTASMLDDEELFCSYRWRSFHRHDLCCLSFISLSSSSCCWSLCPSSCSRLAVLPSSFCLFGILRRLDDFQKFGLGTHSSWEDLHCQLHVDPAPDKVAGSFFRFQKNNLIVPLFTCRTRPLKRHLFHHLRKSSERRRKG